MQEKPTPLERGVKAIVTTLSRDEVTMSNNLHISYDLNYPGQNYDRVIAAIKELGSWAKIHKSFWYVNSRYTAEQAAQHIWAAMDASDSLYVVDPTNNTASWYNIPEGNSEYIQQHWFAMA